MTDWPILAIILGLILIFSLVLVGAVLRAHKTSQNLKDDWKEVVRTQEFQNFLILKIEEDLNGEETSPVIRSYLTALRKIVDKANPGDDALQAIAEVYRYRKGFKNEWIGE